MGHVKRSGPEHGIFGPAQHGPTRSKRAAARHGPVSARADDRFEARGPARRGTISSLFIYFLNFFSYFYIFWAYFRPY